MKSCKGHSDLNPEQASTVNRPDVWIIFRSDVLMSGNEQESIFQEELELLYDALFREEASLNHTFDPVPPLAVAAPPQQQVLIVQTSGKKKAKWRQCTFEGCTKAAQTKRLCTAHGGGPRCQHAGCTKRSQGSGFCRAHGGGRRCVSEGCGKSAQRGMYCAMHGGVKLCRIEGCVRNVRGNGLCAHHGGGKRCTIEHCNNPCRAKGMCTYHNNAMKRSTGPLSCSHPAPPAA